MPFKPGDPKPPGSGRIKGTKNRATVLKATEVMAALGFNPTEFLVKLANSENLADDLKVKIGLELQGYVQPKPKEEAAEILPSSPEDTLPNDQASLLELVESK